MSYDSWKTTEPDPNADDQPEVELDEADLLEMAGDSTVTVDMFRTDHEAVMRLARRPGGVDVVHPDGRVAMTLSVPHTPLCSDCDHEQPAPAPNDSPPIVDLVLADLVARSRLGLSRYGTMLQANNGRDALRDLYEELLDACMYIRQAMAERDGK